MKSLLLMYFSLLLLVTGLIYADTNPVYLETLARELIEVTDFSVSFKNALLNNREMELSYVIEQSNEMGIDRDTIWINDDKRKFSYDEEGILCRQYNYHWNDSEEWVTSSSYMDFNWNEQGKLDSVVMYYSTSEMLIEMYNIIQYYNDMGHIEVAEFHFFNGEELELVADMEFIYDEYDVLESIITNDYNNEVRETNINRNTFSYDEETRMNQIIEEYYDYVSEEWVLEEKIEMTYHPDDTSDYNHFQAFIDRYALMMIDNEYEYFSFKMIQEDSFVMGDSDWELSSRLLYEYNDNGLLAVLLEQELVDEVWITENRKYYYYSGSRISEIVYQELIGEVLTDSERRLYFMADTSSTENNATTKPVLSVQNYPNPFNPETTIAFTLPADELIELAIYNTKGQKVAVLTNEVLAQGEHKIAWKGVDDNGNTLGSGIYFYRLSGKTSIVIGKMLLLK